MLIPSEPLYHFKVSQITMSDKNEHILYSGKEKHKNI